MKTIELRPDQPFDLDLTLACGQAFRWEKAGGWWRGVVEGRAVRIRQDGCLLAFEGADDGFVRDYPLDQDLSRHSSSIDRDAAIGAAIRECRGCGS